MPKRAVVLMAKYPELGQVKTRLAATIGKQAAYAVYRNLLGRIITEINSLNPADFVRAVAVAPVALTDKFAAEFSGFDSVIPQQEGDLGERMWGVIEHFTQHEACESCILVGADIPELNRDIIEQAADRLNSAELVLGPTEDGGYYLIGMNRVYPELFEGIEWGGEKVMEQTLAKAMLNKTEVKTLGQLRDLNELDDLEYFRSIKLGTL